MDSSKKLKHTDRESLVVECDLSALKLFTQARIGLGRSGASQPTSSQLKFALDHALARDAVNIPLSVEDLTQALLDKGIASMALHSCAHNRQVYLQRPDLGRRLNEASRSQLESFHCDNTHYDVAIVIEDGLSSTAIQHHAASLARAIINRLDENHLVHSPVCIIEQGRVAIGDEVGALLKAKSTLLMVGERPGLSSPDSIGIYYTYCPKLGLTDANRNCISNIRPAGMSVEEAANKAIWLIQASFKRQLSGVELKDRSKGKEMRGVAQPPLFLTNTDKIADKLGKP